MLGVVGVIWDFWLLVYWIVMRICVGVGLRILWWFEFGPFLGFGFGLIVVAFWRALLG